MLANGTMPMLPSAATAGGDLLDRRNLTASPKSTTAVAEPKELSANTPHQQPKEAQQDGERSGAPPSPAKEAAAAPSSPSSAARTKQMPTGGGGDEHVPPSVGDDGADVKQKVATSSSATAAAAAPGATAVCTTTTEESAPLPATTAAATAEYVSPASPAVAVTESTSVPAASVSPPAAVVRDADRESIAPGGGSETSQGRGGDGGVGSHAPQLTTAAAAAAGPARGDSAAGGRVAEAASAVGAEGTRVFAIHSSEDGKKSLDFSASGRQDMIANRSARGMETERDADAASLKTSTAAAANAAAAEQAAESSMFAQSRPLSAVAASGGLDVPPVGNSGSLKRKNRANDAEDTGVEEAGYAFGQGGAGSGAMAMELGDGTMGWGEDEHEHPNAKGYKRGLDTKLLEDPPLGEGWDEHGNDLSKIRNDAIRKAHCEAWVAKLRQEASAIRSGDHPEVLRRSKLAVRAGDRREDMCRRTAKRQKYIAGELLKRELESIDDAYTAAMEQTRERLLAEVNEELRRSKSRLEGGKEVENRMSTRHTRGAAKLVEDPWAVGASSKNNGNSKRAMCHVELALSDDEASDDVDNIRYAIYEDARHANSGGRGNGGGASGGSGAYRGGGGGAYGNAMPPSNAGRARRLPAWRRED